jgi:integrase
MANANSNRRRKFSAAFVTRVIKGELTGEFADTESPLRIKRTKTGATYLIRKRVDGRLQNISARDAHGSPVKDAARLWSLTEARTWASGVVADLTRGKAPVRRERSTEIVTFASLAAELMPAYEARYTANSVAVRKRGLASLEPIIGNKPVSEIGAADAVNVREKLPTVATKNRAWVAASWVMRHAVERGLADVNPFGRGQVRPPERTPSRTRYPKLPEIVAIESAAAKLGVAGDTGANIIRFAIRTALRATAITSLKWRELDLDAGEMHLEPIPGRKMKTEAGVQRMPLNAMAVELLREVRPGDPDPDALVFEHNGGPFKSWYALEKRLKPACGVYDWSLHDFRRSIPSIIMQLDDPPCSAWDLDRFLMHSVSATMGSVAATYQRAEGFRSAKRAADGWGDVLRSALADNFLMLRRVG